MIYFSLKAFNKNQTNATVILLCSCVAFQGNMALTNGTVIPFYTPDTVANVVFL